MIDFRLKVFCSVARHLSFTKASKELLVSQPAISKHIQELETEYETRLFERKSSGIELTPAGALLLAHAKEILRNYRQLDFEMNLLLRYSGEKLLLGISPAVAQLTLGNLTSFQERIKPIEVSVLCSSPQAVVTAVATGELALGIIEEGYRKEGLLYTPIRRNEQAPTIGGQSFCIVHKPDIPVGIASAVIHYLTR